MYQLKSLEDTIAAISTPAGQGALGIVRLSGKEALGILEKIFLSKDQKKLSEVNSHTAHYGHIVLYRDGKKEIVDEVLATIMRAPRSYTKEDVVEISCHGGAVVLHKVLSLAVNNGARLAEPGEFTKRAFLNGRIDLAQAEAVLDIIQSKTDAFLKISENQLKGELSLELESIREELMVIYVELEAIVNFPEDDINAQSRARIAQKIDSVQQRVGRLLISGEQGRVLREGIKIVLCGKPNVGKSSLLNVFLREPRAIVSEIAGTTRDTIEETAQIGGVPLQLVDTAGILEPRDLIEEEAIRRSRMSINSADLILLILDASTALTSEDAKIMQAVEGQNILIIKNKCDLKDCLQDNEVKKIFPKAKIIKVSALKKEGIDELERALLECVLHGEPMNTNRLLVSNIRHLQALKECQETLIKACENVKSELSFEFVSEDIKLSVNYLDAITGRNIDLDLLDSIFSKFCIGK